MNIKRIIRHLFTTRLLIRRAFTNDVLSNIDNAIKESEIVHLGEIRFVVESALDGTPLFKGQSARERAIDVFSQLRIWDTKDNTGVLIYLLLADRDVEIVADRGINGKVSDQHWEKICLMMKDDFKKGDYEAGVLNGIRAITTHLIEHFPVVDGDENELPNRPVVL